MLRKTHEEAFNKLKSLMEKTKNQMNIYKTLIHCVNFSDSIVVFSRDNSLNSLRAIIDSAKNLMVKAMQNEIPIKGAVAYGEISVDVNDGNQIFCGQPIIDAFLFQDLQLYYYGVVFLHSFEDFIIKGNKNMYDDINNEKDIHKKSIIEIETPIKVGIVNHLNLNWFSNFSDDNHQFSKIIGSILVK
ncbi:MAG: hypothetical protein FWF51_07080 [Chitinivibrionia bacterium]|nr:hypothetical protein [Chitinivibrionia bacterium]